jgi:hypothetical protein
MNHRKAIPANGTRFRPTRISPRRSVSRWSVLGSPSPRALRMTVMGREEKHREQDAGHRR